MMSNIRFALLTSVSLVSANAWAQEQPPATTAQPPAVEQPTTATPAEPERGGMDVVIVTAERRSEDVQEIPLALSAFGADDIQNFGVGSIENIAPRIPSFYFGSFGAARPQLYIRGIGTRSFDPGSESSVGVFVDDVYMGRTSGSFGSLKDIERIEVLRGPQGTLYGRNTIAGAINVISKSPTPEYGGHIEIGASDFNGFDVQGAVGGPLNEDKSAMFRVAGWRTYREGYLTNLTTGNTFQGIDNAGGRARLLFEPTDRFTVDLIAEITHDGSEGGFGGINQGTGPSAAGAPANPNTVFFAPASRVPVTPVDLRHARLSIDPALDRNTISYTGKLSYDFDDLTLTSITGYRKLDISDSRDLEGSSLDVLNQSSRENSEQITQELRLTSDPNGAFSFGGKARWILGAFYYQDDSDRTDTFGVGIDSVVRAAAGTPATDVASSVYSIESYAYFGQVDIDLTDNLGLTLGARYSNDDKTARQGGTTTDAAPIIAAAFTTTNSASYDSFDPRVVLTYKINDDMNVYASYSTGFKSGGFQYVPFSLAQANVLFNPEDITAYEIGYKSEWLDNRLRINAATFYYDYKDLQVSRIIDAGGAPVSLISNAASSSIKGFDLEVLAQPIPELELSLAYGYLDAQYDEYVFNTTLDFSGTTMVRAPKSTINVGAEWTVPFADNDLSFRADYAYLSKFFHEPGEGSNVYGSGIPLTVEDGYGLLDLRVAYRTPNWTLTGYVTNATDEEYRRTVNALGSTIVGFAGQPRIYGVKLGYDF